MIDNLQEIKILLVEDDPISNFITKSKLTKIGAEKVDVTENGQCAISFLEGESPDLIFLDINMPIMDGFEFLEQCRQNRIWSLIPVVILTSSVRPCDKESALEYSNVIGFFEKPLNQTKIDSIFLKYASFKTNYMQ